MKINGQIISVSDEMRLSNRTQEPYRVLELEVLEDAGPFRSKGTLLCKIPFFDQVKVLNSGAFKGLKGEWKVSVETNGKYTELVLEFPGGYPPAVLVAPEGKK